MSKRIVLTGGGSGGHIFPLIAVAKEYKKKHPDAEFLYIGTGSQMGKKAEEIMLAEGIKTKNILAGKVRRYFSFRNLFDMFLIPIGFMQSLFHLLVFMPDAVFSKGGYVSVPVVIAAWVYRIPVLTHDSDAIPGWATRICGKFSKYIAISYKRSADYFISEKTLLTGNPIRKELFEGDKERGMKRWKFHDSQPVVFVTGGSQGAQNLNKAIVKILPDLVHVSQILHITGPNNFEGIKQLAGEYGFKADEDYVAVPFLDQEEMADAYAVADLVISRSGANSISEIAGNRKPSILIPLSSAANNHQYMNAFEIAKMGGASVLEEGNLGRFLFLEKIKKLLFDKELTSKMKEKVYQFYRPDAAEKIVEGIEKMI